MGRVHRIIGISDTAIKLTLVNDETEDSGVTWPWFAAILPGTHIAIVNAEVDKALLRHGVVAWSTAGDVEVETASLNRVELVEQSTEHTTHWLLVANPYSNGEIIAAQMQCITIRHFDDTVAAVEHHGAFWRSIWTFSE